MHKKKFVFILIITYPFFTENIYIDLVNHTMESIHLKLKGEKPHNIL